MRERVSRLRASAWKHETARLVGLMTAAILASSCSRVPPGFRTKVKVTGRKADVLEYDTYSRHPGGRHLYSYKTMNELHPEKLVELAVRRMLPKSKMGRNILGKLKIYKGDKHPHQAQQPRELKIA